MACERGEMTGYIATTTKTTREGYSSYSAVLAKLTNGHFVLGYGDGGAYSTLGQKQAGFATRRAAIEFAVKELRKAFAEPKAVKKGKQ